ncbi:hypothetical protein U0O11_10910 [Cobetia sp. D5]|uniref:O-antigen ligase family protein n=1 Tax=Cobetia sp. D5 TaxID=3105867 RepID=UPI002D78CB86|nr:hypothetical protein [Cobetia sp. D5]
MAYSLNFRKLSIFLFTVMFLSFSLALWNEGMLLKRLGELLKWPSLLSISLVSLFLYRNNNLKKINVLSLLVLTFIISIGLSTALSPYLNWGGVGNYILYVYLFIICFVIPVGINGKDLNYIIAVSIGFVSSITVVISAASFMSTSSWWDGRYSGIFHNPNGMGSMALVALLSAISFRKDMPRILFWGLIFTSVSIVFLSQSRAVLLGLIVCIIMLSYKYLDFRKTIGSIFFVSLTLLLYIIYFKSSENFKSRDVVIGLDDARANMLDTHISLFLDSPYIGQGLSENINGGRLVSELAYADILSFSGIIGFTLFILSLLYVSWQGFKVFKMYDDYHVGNYLIFLSVLVMSIGEGYISSIGNSLPLFCWFYFSTFRCQKN